MSRTTPLLKRVEFGVNTTDTIAALVRLLSPHAPYSLHILGNILNTCPRSETIGNVDPSQVTIWSTTPLPSPTDSHDASVSPSTSPALFSVLIFSPVSHQFRFFCSADSLDGPPKEEEEAHVLLICRSVLHMAVMDSPTYDSILTRKSTGTGVRPADRADCDPPMIVFGGIHKKWRSCLRSLAACQNPCFRYILPPSPSIGRVLPKDGPESSDDWVVDHIRESDIDLIRSTSTIPRSADYIMSRAPYSVCLRSRGDRGEGPDGQKPIAWALMHADGSIGTLHVDPARRREGLAKFVLKKLVQKFDGQGRKDATCASVLADLGGGALGWNWTDTDVWNEAANRFFGSFEGWQKGWTCDWTYMTIPAQVTSAK
ncbi:hypothetical protein HYDPIDRAFT_83949 [Hydnomerulius pinastri MD-312]|nr:hypothetical protein HYDPIDRAFT_83949 [Hydnomerulius pinastri MD-312]